MLRGRRSTDPWELNSELDLLRCRLRTIKRVRSTLADGFMTGNYRLGPDAMQSLTGHDGRFFEELPLPTPKKRPGRAHQADGFVANSGAV